jgi:hypothetical protein
MCSTFKVGLLVMLAVPIWSAEVSTIPGNFLFNAPDLGFRAHGDVGQFAVELRPVLPVQPGSYRRASTPLCAVARHLLQLLGSGPRTPHTRIWSSG